MTKNKTSGDDIPEVVVRYLQELEKLDLLIRSDLGQVDAANVSRDVLEMLWEKMSPEEKLLARTNDPLLGDNPEDWYEDEPY